MCYSFKTSVVSYSLGMLSAIFCFCTRQIVLGTLILCYCQMQLSEMIIWHGIDNNNDNTNKLGTSIGKYLLATHNIAIGIGIILYVIFILKRKMKLTDFIPVLVGLAFFIFVVVYYYLPNNYPSITRQLKPCDSTSKCQNSKNRLVWPFPHGWYFFSFIISLLILLFYIKPLSTKIWLASVFTVTFLFTLFLMKANVVGSVWCFSTAILAPVIGIVGYFLIREKNKKDVMT